MECQYVATQRGGVALVFEGHRYNKVRDGKDGTVYWRCSRDRQCPGRAVTVNNRVKKANNKHNHAPEASLRNGNAVTSSSGLANHPLSGHHSSHLSGHHHPHHHQSPSSSTSSHHHHSGSHHLSSNRQQSNHSPIGTSATGRGISPSLLQLAQSSEAPPNLRLPSSHHSSSSHLTSSSATALDVAAQNAAAVAAMAAFPGIPPILEQMVRYLAAASGNPQMAAFLASSALALNNNNNNDSKDTNRFPLRPFIDHGSLDPSVTYIPGGNNAFFHFEPRNRSAKDLTLNGALRLLLLSSSSPPLPSSSSSSSSYHMLLPLVFLDS